MNKMLFILTAIFGIFFVSYSVSQADIYYVSGSVDDKLIIAPESSVWHLDDPTGDSIKIYSSKGSESIPKLFNKFQFWSEENMMLGWVLSDKGQGQLLWLPLLEPEEFKYIKLPFPPLFTGYLWKESRKIVTEGFKRDSAVYSIAEQSISTIKGTCGIPRDKLYQDGFSLQMKNYSPVLVDIQKAGGVDYRIGLERCPSGYQLGKEDVNSLNHMIQGTVGRVFNNAKVFALGFAESQNEKKRSCYLFYIKGEGKWVKYCVQELALAKMRGNWIFFQYVTLDESKINQNKDGNFQFYNIENKQSFNAKLGHDSEVLDLDDDWLLYRAGDALYKAQIKKDYLSESIKLISADHIKNVHWAIWAENQSEILDQKINEQQRDMGLWLLLIGGIALLGLGAYFARGRKK